MSRTTITLISGLVLISAPTMTSPVMARTDVTLSPSTPWNLDVSDSGCALRRGFGPPDNTLLLEIRRYGPGDGFQLSADGKYLAGLVLRPKVTVEYGDLWKDEGIPFQPGTTKRDGANATPSIFLSSALMRADEDTSGGAKAKVPDAKTIVTPAMEAGVKQVALTWGSGRVVLATGSLGKAFAAIRSCTDALLQAWDLDPAVQNSLSTHASPVSMKAMVRAIQAVYPATMAAQGRQGRVNFRALVDAQGTVTKCGTMKSYNEPAFDDLACKVVQRTRFDPALDKGGKPVASYYVATVVYSMG